MRLRGGGGSDDERDSKRAKLGTTLDTPPEVKTPENRPGTRHFVNTKLVK